MPAPVTPARGEWRHHHFPWFSNRLETPSARESAAQRLTQNGGLARPTPGKFHRWPRTRALPRDRSLVRNPPVRSTLRAVNANAVGEGI